MRFSMIMPAEKPAFILGQPVVPPPTASPLAAPELVVTLLPEHPFAFPPFSEIMSAVTTHPDILTRLREKLGAARLTILLPKQLRDRVYAWESPGRVKVVGCPTEYPLTEKRLKELARAEDDSLPSLGWFEFYLHLLELLGEGLPGLPVSLSFPAENEYFSGRVGEGHTLRRALEALPERSAYCDADDCLCLDHPFRGAIVPLDQPLDEFKPYHFILLPKNKRQTVPRRERLAAMVWEKRYKTFHGYYHSLPTLLDTPCQRCLHCAAVCPVDIVPFMIAALFEKERVKEAVEFKPGACIECGLCSYVCPSGIPLLHRIRSLKKKAGLT